ncbi:hypothetical protein QBC40DRAFT_283877 [Triangularia verruculosa]|uniref:CFEM domain-containing protein n=1 Tax=Triangularia verruculosa TaxID=2587418 RepID=A0AAN7ARF1_9PEZI|nr:hypothetical protein QBC40DRAFT_283877 [Triangularia verruculosa]
MKYTAALVSLALATTVAAQGLNDLPPCARDCATQYLRGGIGNCGSDPECICKNSTFLDSIACCLVDVCSPADQKTAVSVAATLCKAFGVNDLPTAVVCGTVSPSASAPVKTSSPPANTSVAPTTTGGGNTSAVPTGTGTETETDAPDSTETNAPEESSSSTASDADAQDATSTSSSTSTNFGPRPTVAAGLGAIGGLAAALVLL